MGERATGELRELKDRLNRLHGVKSTKEVSQNKSVLFRRVIHLMVSGVDVSELFSSMVLASTPDEPALKKLLYLYICTHARSNPDLALMTINTLTVDCASEDATIRRSALRSLCSLGTPNLADYLVKPIQDGLADRSVLVRRVAVVGVLKLHGINPELVENAELLDRLRALLYEEKDTQVLSNCMVVISKLEGREKLLEKGFVYTLLNNLSGFSVWGRSIALDIISSYRPSSEEEMYDIMNILEDHLASVNSAVVLAGVKVAFCMTTALPAVHDLVLQRIKPPLLTIASSGYPGPQYIALCHVVGLSGIEPALFSHDLTRLYCRDSDPTFVKQKKMTALVQVANEKNVYDIVTELKNYTHDVKKKTAATAVSCIGQIALSNLAAAGVVECLLEYIIEGRIHVASAALVCARDVFRKHPHATIGWTEDLINLDFQLLDSLESEIAGLWIMGEYPELFAEPAHILENYVDCTDQILDSTLKLQLLTTCNKLFFKNPASCNSIFQRLLSILLRDKNPLVQDQAFLYYKVMNQDRPLSQDIASLRIAEHLNVGNRMVDGFADKDQFNSLSMVCTSPSRVL